MKTKETLICRKCGGNGKPSKGYVNFHNIQTSDLSKEFETKLLDCIKCESCGHSWIPNKTTREQALAWWNKLTSLEKGLNCPHGRNQASLTGREIEQIWLKETGGELATGGEKVLEILNSKSNQKQFQIVENSTYGADSKNHPVNRKQFVEFDESLFRAYIDKMPESESLNMIKIIYKTKLPDCKFKEHLKKWFKL